MKISVLCSDIPYPPNHGGRIDVWTRLLALKKLGVELQLVLWQLPSETITPEQLEKLHSVAVEIIQIPRSHSVYDYIRLRYPPRMYSFFSKQRFPTDVIRQVINFSPDWIWLDGWHGYLFAQHLKNEHHIPFVYRSQNVEYEYFAFQAESSTGIKRHVLTINARRLKSAEVEMREHADIVFDISSEDAQHWNIPLNIGKWRILPTVYTAKTYSLVHERIYDIGFIGNLWTPNNREGLVWFVYQVLPIIRTRIDRKLRIVFAGASPHESILELCRRFDIECIASPNSVDEYYQNTLILINPALNASGINIKMLDMLASGNMIVSTDIAIRGIPKELLQYVNIARNAKEFAEHCIESIENPEYLESDVIRGLLQQYYGEHHIAEALEVMHNYQGGRT